MQIALLNFLVANAGVDDRIAWGLIPQGTAFPYIVLNRVSGLPEYQHSGDTNYTEYRVQIDVYGKTYKDAHNLSVTIRNLISGKKFANFDGAFLLNVRDLHEDDQSAGKQIFRISADYQINYKE